MSDFFKDFTDSLTPTAREFTFNGVTKTIYVKKLTAAQKLQLDRGQAININVGEGKKTKADQRMQVDYGDFEQKRQLKVMYCVVDAGGKPHFRNLAQVQEQPADLIAALGKIVDEETAEDPGK